MKALIMKKLRLIDEQTGELVQLPVYLNSPRKQQSIYGDGWIQMAQGPTVELAKDRELWGMPQAVLLYLIGRLDFENFIHVSQQEIAEALKAHRPDVTKAITKLVDKQILIRGPKIGRAGSYRLNPAYGWKGDNTKAKEYQLELIKGGKA
jgi:hypothetical protein